MIDKPMTPKMIRELIGTIEICRRHGLPLNNDECEWITRALLELHDQKTAMRTPCETKKVEE